MAVPPRRSPVRGRVTPHSCRSRALAALLAAAALAGLAGCERRPLADARFTQVPEADPTRGQALLAQYQCGSCHAIPEVPASEGAAGPTLAAFGRRSYIAGEVPNLPANLIAWIESPQALVPGTPMPDMGVSPRDARDIAAYLMSLR
ncbi:c-type cytochrome [Piscinibacter koreensis]|uniref:Cytochrome c n=1 Tax=Piscinibacter koreensis TaxID=2742824 RepID=A0A7Y6NPQ0_9BURK|nr:cytochrome c [Schlegelella koreensis]NUZ07016.1 cytochrome c [Schlegelella koreensis]